MAAWGGAFLFAWLLYIHSLLSKNNNCIKKEEKLLAWLGFAIIIISEKNRLVSRNFGQTDFPTYSLSFYCCPGQKNGEKATIEFFAQWTNGEFAPFYFCKLTRTFHLNHHHWQPFRDRFLRCGKCSETFFLWTKYFAIWTWIR